MSSHERPRNAKGSVRAARERAEAGLPRAGGTPPISRPIQMPQWPLAGHSNGPSHGNSANISPATVSPPRTPRTPRSRNAASPDHSPQKVSPSAVTPPRRPERPRDVPSMLDGSKIQYPIPTFQSTAPHEPRNAPLQETTAHSTPPKNPQQLEAPAWNHGNVLLTPNEPSTPGTGLSVASNSSRPSTTSSFGSIPDFPVPDMPQQSMQGPPRRSLGPPPTSRRGVSSYYSHNSYVAPIPEEHGEPKNHHSYASSHAVPRNWVDGAPEYYMSSYREEDEQEAHGDEPADVPPTDSSEKSGLVRKASMGRQFKPSLTTVRSNSSSSSAKSRKEAAQAVAATSGRKGTAGAIAAAVGGALGFNAANQAGDTLPARAYGDSVYVSPEVSSPTSPRSIPADPRVRQILGGLEKGGALGNVDELPPSAIRRPPRLDMGAVREVESRGSLTSLPDLIKRATKLASNLDKGRTASRLGMLDFNTSDPNMLAKLNEHRDRQLKGQRDSTISGILSSFPAPNLTPTGERSDPTGGSYDSNGRDLMTPLSPLKPECGPERPRRRCCGMPLWLFLMILLLLLVVMAAAIVLPVVLVVIPQNNASSSSANPLAQCATSTPCQHGGTSVVANNACQCVCAGGFTGATCTTANDGACTNSNVGSYKGATLGSSVGRLFSTASSQFNINLNATAILATFANSNISCASENALISFNGQTQKRDIVQPAAVPALAAPGWAAMEAAIERRRLAARQVTSNGIVLATMSASATLPTAATVTGTAVATGSGAAATSPPSPSDQDFARVAILFALGSSHNLNTALDVQSTLMSKLQEGGFDNAPVNAGNGFVVDFQKHTISINGTNA